MKNLSIVLNVVLLGAVVVLFVLHFSSKGDVKLVTNDVRPDTLAVASGNTGGAFAYIYVDSLLNEYEYYRVLEEKLAAKQSSLEAALKRKKKAFEDDYIKFMEKVQRGTFLSQDRAAEEENRLANMQQELILYEQDLTKELMDEGKNMEYQLIDTLVNYLKEFNSDRRYQYIFNAASCLYLEESNDVTQEVIQALNQRYKTTAEQEIK